MEENIAFKTAAVGGFEKRAVLDYIYETSEKHQQEVEALLQKIEETNFERENHASEVQALNSRILEMEETLSSASNELESGTEKHDELIDQNVSLKNEIQSLKEQLKNKDSEIAQKTKELDDVAANTKELEAKRDEIEKASYQLGRVMLDARADADIIVSNAQEQARGITSGAEGEVDKIYTRAEEEAEEILSSARAQADEILAETEIVSQEKLSMADEKALEVIKNARGRIGDITGTTKKVSDTATVQLRDLRRESFAVRQAIQEVFTTLQEKAVFLDSTIEKAIETLENEDFSSESDFEIPEMDISDIQNRIDDRKQKIRQEIMDEESSSEIRIPELLEKEEFYKEIFSDVPESVEKSEEKDLAEDEMLKDFVDVNFERDNKESSGFSISEYEDSEIGKESSPLEGSFRFMPANNFDDDDIEIEKEYLPGLSKPEEEK